MKIYHLQKKGKVNWDESDSFVVIAEDSKEARKLASIAHKEDFWLDSGQTSCEELKPTKKGVVICNFNAFTF